ncbi:MAG TPA: carboxymuconolactone decarboxylase family protein [Patescibacteria group bacterium]|nr:carboxymuconolactone decarboxylase family protein [Patescibacteria group bacterium]
MTFKVLDRDTAPAASVPFLEEIESKKGFVPNIAGVLAAAPPALEAFVTLQELLGKTSLSAVEKDILFLAISTFNDSPYCQAAFAKQAEADGMTWEMEEAVKTGQPLPNPKLDALRNYARGVLENRGRPDDATIEAFLAAGYGPANALEILLAISFNTLTNYTARLAHPPIDAAVTGQPSGQQQQAVLNN